MGKAGGVEHHLLDADRLLAMASEGGNVLDDGFVEFELALSDQGPDRRSDEGLGGGEKGVLGVVAGVTEGLERYQLALVSERDLTRGEQSVVDLAAGAFEECFQPIRIDALDGRSRAHGDTPQDMSRGRLGPRCVSRAPFALRGERSLRSYTRAGC